MRRRFAGRMLASLVVLALLATESGATEKNGPMSSAGNSTVPVAGAVPDTSVAGSGAALDVQKLFANTCGWCHSDAGRVAGRGPKLMGTTLTDAEIIHRIKVGKPGAMPSFDGVFNGDEIQAIVKYIRGLKEDGVPK